MFVGADVGRCDGANDGDGAGPVDCSIAPVGALEYVGYGAGAELGFGVGSEVFVKYDETGAAEAKINIAGTVAPKEGVVIVNWWRRGARALRFASGGCEDTQPGRGWMPNTDWWIGDD